MTNAHTRTRPLRPPARLSEHVKRTFALALPVMFGRAGLLMAITVALVVVGHAGPNDQAYFAAGFAFLGSSAAFTYLNSTGPCP